MSANNPLPIHERFHSWQGEGVFMGQAAFFIRTYGCPVHCHFCDSAGTWHPNWVPKHVTRMVPAELVEEAVEAGPGFVVITGGEPAVHDLTELTLLLSLANKRVHLETSGAFQIRGTFDWITISPKRDKHPMTWNFPKANEFKLIIEQPGDIDYWLNNGVPHNRVPVWLHPEWSQRNNLVVLEYITSFVKLHGGMFRAGWQLHKNYKADSLDNRSAPLVPLGGNPDKGL